MRFSNVALALFVIVSATSHTQAASYSAEYVFGDSLTDSGNLVLAVQANPQLAPGFSHPSPPYAGGRFSNGPVWPELLGSQLGLSVTPSLLGGSNYSFAGAKTGGGALIPSVAAQATSYLTARNGVADPNALYVINGGTNDIRAATTLNLDIAQEAANNISSVMTALYNAGARNFLVATPGDVSLQPEVQGAGPALAGLRDIRASLSLELRNDLLANLALFETTHADARVAELDVFSLSRTVVANPSLFGFTNVTDACFDPATGTVCATPDSYLFFDDEHPTARAHLILAQAAFAAVSTTAVPGPIAGAGFPALLAVGGFLWVRRRTAAAHGRRVA